MKNLKFGLMGFLSASVLGSATYANTCSSLSAQVGYSLRTSSNAANSVSMPLQRARQSVFTIEQMIPQLSSPPGQSLALDSELRPLVSESVQIMAQVETIEETNINMANAAVSESSASEARSMMGRLAGNLEQAQDHLVRVTAKVQNLKNKISQLHAQAHQQPVVNTQAIRSGIELQLRDVNLLTQSLQGLSSIERLTQDIADYIYNCSPQTDSYCYKVRADLNDSSRQSLTLERQTLASANLLLQTSADMRSQLKQIPNAPPTANLSPLVLLVDQQILPLLEQTSASLASAIASSKVAHEEEDRNIFNKRVREANLAVVGARNATTQAKSSVQDVFGQAQVIESQLNGVQNSDEVIASLDRSARHLEDSIKRITDSTLRLGQQGAYQSELDRAERAFRNHASSCEPIL